MHTTILVIVRQDAHNAVDWERELEPFTVPWEILTSDKPCDWWVDWNDTLIRLPFDYYGLESRIDFGVGGILAARDIDARICSRFFRSYRPSFDAVVVDQTWHCAAEFTGKWKGRRRRVSDGREGHGRVVAYNETDDQWAAAMHDRFINRLLYDHFLVAVDIHY